MSEPLFKAKRYRYFPLNFTKFLRTPFFIEHLRWLLLNLVKNCCNEMMLRLYDCNHSLRRHCVKSVQIRSLFWSVFFRIRTEYEELRSISPFLVRMRENTDQKILLFSTLFTQWGFFLKQWFIKSLGWRS